MTIAPGTRLRFELTAVDARDDDKVFRYAATGLPPGAVLDPKTGRFSWVATASTAPIEMELAAIDGGTCAITKLTVRVAETPAAVDARTRLEFFEALRDEDLAAIPSEEDIRLSWIDGESAESHAARVEAEISKADVARASYEAKLRCGHLPGGTRMLLDVDGDGDDDSLFDVGSERHWVLLQGKTGLSPAGTVTGSPAMTTVDGHILFTREYSIENSYTLSVDWIDAAGKAHGDSISGESGATKIEWVYQEGRVAGVIVESSNGRRELAWHVTGFFEVKKP